MQGLRAQGRGFAVGPVRVPIVPGAIVFDLLNGGDKDWADSASPYPALGRRAFDAAAPDFALGTAGAGFGAMTGTLKGGLGSASCVLPSGLTVGALVVVNALGQATVGETPHFWAAPWEEGRNSAAFGPAPMVPQDAPCRANGWARPPPSPSSPPMPMP
jgi:L-aminopeptidase/D-esterase-like protein